MDIGMKRTLIQKYMAIVMWVELKLLKFGSYCEFFLGPFSAILTIIPPDQKDAALNMANIIAKTAYTVCDEPSSLDIDITEIVVFVCGTGSSESAETVVELKLIPTTHINIKIMPMICVLFSLSSNSTNEAIAEKTPVRVNRLVFFQQ